MPSDLLLPVVPGLAIPTALPPCPGLRGQPCRTYQAYSNRSVEVSSGPAKPKPKPKPKQKPKSAPRG